MTSPCVMPAEAGIQLVARVRVMVRKWIPAFAGMTLWIWPPTRHSPTDCL
jgi:hypothetical protein